MRMRSAALILVSSAASVAGLPMLSASATDSTTVIRSLSAGQVGSSGLKLNNTDCFMGGSGTATATTVSGPATAPLGSGSLRFSMGSNEDTQTGLYKTYGDPVGNPAGELAPSQLTAFSFSAYGVSGNDPLFVDLYLDRDGSAAETHVDALDLQLPNAAGWQSVNALTATYAVYPEADFSQNPTAVQTITDYLTANPNAKIINMAMDNGCAALANQSVYLDNLTYGDNGTDATTYNFEPTSSISTLLGAGTITSGATRVISGVLKSGTTALTGKNVDVWAKAYPATTYSKIATVVTDGTGKASYSAKPTVQTSYQLKYAGAEPDNGSATSAIQVVNVATAITKNVYDTTVTTAQTILAWGLTKAAKPGTTVTLYRGATAVSSTKVASDGTYLIQGRITVKGKWLLVVKGAAGSGNLAGASAGTYVTVS